MEILVNSEERKELTSKNSYVSMSTMVEEREKLILQNRGLLYRVANRFDVSPSEYEDLISVGTIGLIKATNTFDESRNVKFSTYASACICNEMRKYFSVKKMYAKDISLDEPISVFEEGSETTLGDKIPSPDSEFEEKFEKRESFLRVMSIILNMLGTKEKLIMLYRMSGVNQKVIREALKISRSYAAKLAKKVVKKIKGYLESPQKFEGFYVSSIKGSLYQISFEIADDDFVDSLKRLITNERWMCNILYNGKQATIMIPKEREHFFCIAKLIEKIEDYRMNC